MSDERPEDVAGDTPDDDTVSMQAIEPEPESVAPHSGRSLLPAIALATAVLAVAASGVAMWQYRQSLESLRAADSAAQTTLERVQAAATDSEAARERLQTAVDDNLRELRGVRDRLEALPGRFVDIERRIDAIQGGSFDARTQWLEAEAAYYLGVANAELQLGRRWGNALTALRLADGRLRAIGDPGLAGVREQLAAEILALESVRQVDTEGLAHSLSRLSARAAALPLRAGDRGDESAAAASQEEPGFGRLWSSVRNAFSSIVTVERRDDSIRAQLSVAEERLIRRQLSVELQTARLALISGEGAIFRTSLEQAATLLRNDFDAGSADVEGGLRLVESLLELDIDPSPPDISRSLSALRARGEP